MTTCHYCQHQAKCSCKKVVSESRTYGRAVCGRPLCERHKIRVGYMSVRINGKMVDATIDHCPDCGR